jgi:hypothetical protein
MAATKIGTSFSGRYIARKCGLAGFNQMQSRGQSGESYPLIFVEKVDSCFLQSIARTQKERVLEFPESEKTCIRPACCGKQSVDVQKQPVHLGRSPARN